MASLLSRYSLVLVVVTLFSACNDSGNNSASQPFLHVSVTDYYFGTRDVGTTTTQKVELTNRSGDIYPLHHLSLKGENADEFNVNFGGGITLNPSQKIAVDVSFTPVTNGTKSAALDIDYEIIPQVTTEDNLNEQLYYQAQDMELAAAYPESREQYREYLDKKPVTVNRKRAEIKLPVLDESDRYGDGPDLTLYVTALNQRDGGDSTVALKTLQRLIRQYPDSYLRDDALYLSGYIQLIDHDDPSRAQLTMSRLRKYHPDSSYFDTALYSEALSYEEMGDVAAARQHFDELKERHRSTAWASIGLTVAKDEFVSRLWLQRATTSLDRLAQL